MSDIVVFSGGAIAGILTWLTILRFKHLIRIGKQPRRSVFVTIVTLIMGVCAFVIELAVQDRLLLVVVLTLSSGA